MLPHIRGTHSYVVSHKWKVSSILQNTLSKKSLKIEIIVIFYITPTVLTVTGSVTFSSMINYKSSKRIRMGINFLLLQMYPTKRVPSSWF